MNSTRLGEEDHRLGCGSTFLCNQSSTLASEALVKQNRCFFGGEFGRNTHTDDKKTMAWKKTVVVGMNKHFYIYI